MPQQKRQIAIDGFSSCGKSTLAKDIAEATGYLHIDSGAMYRAVSLYVLNHELDLTDEMMIHDMVNELTIDFIERAGQRYTRLNGQVVEDAIREPRVSDIVSQVAVIGSVRSRMVDLQREMSRQHTVIMDGRDIGTVVFPDAAVKFFVTADKEVRAERRWLELQAKGKTMTREAVMKNLLLRDHIDSTRAIAPLRQADDAIVIDNTAMTRQEQLNFALECIHQRMGTR